MKKREKVYCIGDRSHTKIEKMYTLYRKDVFLKRG